MVNFESFIESKYIKLLGRIINEPLQSWNAVGKYWLRKLDIRYNESYFLCKCSNLSNFNLNFLPIFYRKAIVAWSKMMRISRPIQTRDDVLKQCLIGNSHLVFQNKSLIFSSFAKSNIKTIRDIWEDDINDFTSCGDLFSKLFDKRNCISEYSRIKKSIPRKFIAILRNEQIDEENDTAVSVIKISENLEFMTNSNKIIEPTKVTLKLIQNILNKDIHPKCQLKWDIIYNEDDNLNWALIWNNLKLLNINKSVKNFNGNVYITSYIQKVG